MTSDVNSAILPPTILKYLEESDDPKLWLEVLAAVAADAAGLYAQGMRSRLYAVIGSCSHWVRPHQSRWTAAGGFALPIGYGDGAGLLEGIPNLDWCVTLQFNPGAMDWASPTQAPTKRYKSVRLAVPARTMRHHQAAVHAIWAPGTLDKKHKRTVYCGFRHFPEGWQLAARSEFGEALKR